MKTPARVLGRIAWAAALPLGACLAINPANLGDPCDTGADCPGGKCVLVARNGRHACSLACKTNDDCIPGWRCEAVGDVCDCDAKPEICNGLDDDCNGIIDDVDAANADCKKQLGDAVCRGGACQCAHTTCGGDTALNGYCANLDTDPKNCGACGNR